MHRMSTSRYIIRLDDACPTMDRERWRKVEAMLDRHDILPIVAVIPNNEDKTHEIDPPDAQFWSSKGVVRLWQQKGWEIALHGYNHALKKTKHFGIIPFHKYSEFVGVSLDEQKTKLNKGAEIFSRHGISTNIWVAPAHSFDINTIRALKECTDISIISDGLAMDVYKKHGFYWIPQQLGIFRKMPFGLWTLCLHPSTMSDKDINLLDNQINKNRHLFINFKMDILKDRNRSLLDNLFRYSHGAIRRIKKLVRSSS